jgi:hypothetical protein
MQVELNTCHWGIQWNCMALPVKKATSQRTGNGGKGRTENRWAVSRAGRSAPPDVCISKVSTSRSQRPTVRSTTDLFLLTLQSAVLSATSVFSVTLHL